MVMDPVGGGAGAVVAAGGMALVDLLEPVEGGVPVWVMNNYRKRVASMEVLMLRGSLEL